MHELWDSARFGTDLRRDYSRRRADIGDPDGGTERGRHGQGRDRTADTRIFSPLLYQLSYLAQGRAIYRYPRPAANSQPRGILGLWKRPLSLLVAASFAAFRADPDWVAAKEASEKKAGGSLTEGGMAGVKSEFLKPTDYSPMK